MVHSTISVKVTEAIFKDDVPSLREYVGQGANLFDLSNLFSQTTLIHAIHYAACRNSVKILTYLIEELHIDPYLGDLLDGTPAIKYAVRNGNLEVFQYLICWGGDIEVANGGETLLNMAIKQGNFPMIKLLVENGANVNAKNLRACIERDI